MRRAICNRCGGNLAIFPDFDDGQYEWTCNTRYTDEEFWSYWNALSMADKARLIAQHPEMDDYHSRPTLLGTYSDRVNAKG